MNDVGAPGSTVAAGTFTITNELAVTETVASLTVSVTRPGLFSSMTLSGGGQSRGSRAAHSEYDLHLRDTGYGSGRRLGPLFTKRSDCG